jgi:alpha-tubulin suppressor-like RCC1 family protein
MIELPAVSLALGGEHTCAVFEDGSVRCWGSGSLLGRASFEHIGDDELPSTAGDVDVGGAVKQLSANVFHTCALLTNGSVRCWGTPGWGKLGYPGTLQIGDDETPASVGNVDVGGPVAQIDVALEHTCAVLRNGRLRCWGRNTSGELGYPGTEKAIGDDETPASAGDVPLSEDVQQVAVGLDFTCALLESGRVECWGGLTIPSRSIDLGGTAVQVVAGRRFACALLDTGAVRCWGRASFGALGYGNDDYIGDDESVAEAGDVDVGAEVVQLSAGDFSVCAVTVNHTVRCWGVNNLGQLGYAHVENIGDDESPSSAGDVQVGAQVAFVDVSAGHTCVVLVHGAVQCWGHSSLGQLGYGNTQTLGDDEVPSVAGIVSTH